MVVKGVCFANKVICFQLCLNMDPVKQNNNEQKVKKKITEISAALALLTLLVQCT